MERLRQDVALAVRFLRKTPGFTLPAVLTLALGIGANTTIFSLTDALLFRRLPVADADRIVHVYQSRPNRPPSPFPTSMPDYFDYREQSRSFDVLSAHYPTSPMHVMVDGDPQSINGAVVTASYFDVVQLQPAAGRFFRADEDQVRDRDAVAVLGFGFAERRFGSAAAAVGRDVHINGRAFTVIGVAPREFTGVRGRDLTDVWIPSAMFANGYRYCDVFQRDCRVVMLLGRLKDGVSPDAAQSELDVIARSLAETYPANKDLGVDVVEARGLGFEGATEERQQLRLFLLVVGIVLLMACANVAGLLMARASGRRKELAMRVALGATRMRLFRQLLTETAVLAMVGALAGLLVAGWGNALLESVYSHDAAGRPMNFPLVISTNVFLATVAVAMLSTLLIGLLPSIAGGRADVVAALKDESGAGGGRRSKARSMLVIAQVAASVMLLIGAVLLLASVANLNRGANFDPEHLASFRLRPSLIDYSRERSHAFQRRALEAIHSVPGVVSATPSVYWTLLGGGGGGFASLTRESSTAAESGREVILGIVGAKYFSTMGVPLIEGRDFTDLDDHRAPAVAVINDVVAEQLFAESSAVGKVVFVNGRPYEVIGVSRDAQFYTAGARRRGQIFVSYWQSSSSDAFLNDARMMVRTAGDPAMLMDAIRKAIVAVDPNVPISEEAPLRDRIKFNYQGVRLARTMMVGFAVLALVLSAVGVYGVLAFSVAQRTREMAIRSALGATRAEVARLILRDGIVMTAAGVMIGLTAAWTSSRFLAGFLYGVDPNNVTAFVLGPALLIAVALAASFLPARRAANVSASAALRCE
ncbi:MAG TPA: ABC transporter permease [Vicinamibacterales bacterium]|nr:ABC transporter permease [Vicinamibacterales bacterium]